MKQRTALSIASGITAFLLVSGGAIATALRAAPDAPQIEAAPAAAVADTSAQLIADANKKIEQANADKLAMAQRIAREIARGNVGYITAPLARQAVSGKRTVALALQAVPGTKARKTKMVKTAEPVNPEPTAAAPAAHTELEHQNPAAVVPPSNPVPSAQGESLEGESHHSAEAHSPEGSQDAPEHHESEHKP